MRPSKPQLTYTSPPYRHTPKVSISRLPSKKHFYSIQYLEGLKEYEELEVQPVHFICVV